MDHLFLYISNLFLVVDVPVCQGEATIHYNKLQADPKQGKSLDIGIFTTHMQTLFCVTLFVFITFCALFVAWYSSIITLSVIHCCSLCKWHILCALVLKKVKHRLVENMSSGTADALGLSRAILCNGKIIIMVIISVLVHWYRWKSSSSHINSCNFSDGLVKRLEELEKTAELYKGEEQSDQNILPSENTNHVMFSLTLLKWLFFCRADGAHEEAAQSIFWAFSDSQRSVTLIRVWNDTTKFSDLVRSFHLSDLVSNMCLVLDNVPFQHLGMFSLSLGFGSLKLQPVRRLWSLLMLTATLRSTVFSCWRPSNQ